MGEHAPAMHESNGLHVSAGSGELDTVLQDLSISVSRSSNTIAFCACYCLDVQNIVLCSLSFILTLIILAFWSVFRQPIPL